MINDDTLYGTKFKLTKRQIENMQKFPIRPMTPALLKAKQKWESMQIKNKLPKAA